MRTQEGTAKVLALAGSAVVALLSCSEPDAVMELGELGAQGEIRIDVAAGTRLRFATSCSYFRCGQQNALMLERALLRDGKVVLEDACETFGPVKGRCGSAPSGVSQTSPSSRCDLDVPEDGAYTLRLTTRTKDSEGEVVARGIKVRVFKAESTPSPGRVTGTSMRIE